jgi:hypothetical protein
MLYIIFICEKMLTSKKIKVNQYYSTLNNQNKIRKQQQQQYNICWRQSWKKQKQNFVISIIYKSITKVLFTLYLSRLYQVYIPNKLIYFYYYNNHYIILMNLYNDNNI